MQYNMVDLKMKTCEEVAYDRLKDLIINNKLPRGEFLSQRKLAESVGATLMSLRSSLRLLENDGLIENIPKWGVRVPVDNEESVKERYYVRELLEVGAVSKILELNVPNARDILMQKAEACDMVKFTDSESFKNFAKKHADLHLTLTRMSGNKLLHRELKRLNFRSMMLENAKYGWEMHHENKNERHHRDFIEAIFTGTRESALEAVLQHVRRGCVMELESLKQINQQQEESFD